VIRSRWDDFWFRWYAPLPLAAFRVVVCVLLLYTFTKDSGFVAPWAGAGQPYFGDGFYSSYASWLTPPPAPVFRWTSRLLVLLTALGLVGLATQASLRAASILFFYHFFLNQFFYSNHLYLLGLFLLFAAFMPCADALSVDAWLRHRHGERSPQAVCSWAATLVLVTVSVVYVGSALSKTNAAWLSGTVLETLYAHNSIVAPPGLAVVEHVPFGLQAIGVVVTEFALAVLLWPVRTRMWAFLIGIGLHVFMDVTMAIGTFSWEMMGAYLVFVALRPAPFFAATPAPIEEREAVRAPE
jgi:hypothetical protein